MPEGYDIQREANNFRSLLEKYAKEDFDVELFLDRMRPWFEGIEYGFIVAPRADYQLYRYFVNPDLSELADKYTGTDLGRASATFTLAIMGWSGS